MNFKRWIMTAGFAMATCSQTFAGQFTTSQFTEGQAVTEKEKLLAPTVVQASCDVGCSSCSSVCDDAASCACGGGLLGCDGCDPSTCDGGCDGLGGDSGLLGYA